MDIDVLGTVGEVASNAAEVLISTVVGVLPIILPVVALFWGINYALRKFGLNRSANTK
jgi:hypothetical protein